MGSRLVKIAADIAQLQKGGAISAVLLPEVGDATHRSLMVTRDPSKSSTDGREITRLVQREDVCLGAGVRTDSREPPVLGEQESSLGPLYIRRARERDAGDLARLDAEAWPTVPGLSEADILARITRFAAGQLAMFEGGPDVLVASLYTQRITLTGLLQEGHRHNYHCTPRVSPSHRVIHFRRTIL